MAQIRVIAEELLNLIGQIRVAIQQDAPVRSIACFEEFLDDLGEAILFRVGRG